MRISNLISSSSSCVTTVRNALASIQIRGRWALLGSACIGLSVITLLAIRYLKSSSANSVNGSPLGKTVSKVESKPNSSPDIQSVESIWPGIQTVKSTSTTTPNFVFAHHSNMEVKQRLNRSDFNQEQTTYTGLNWYFQEFCVGPVFREGLQFWVYNQERWNAICTKDDDWINGFCPSSIESNVYACPDDSSDKKWFEVFWADLPYVWNEEESRYVKTLNKKVNFEKNEKLSLSQMKQKLKDGTIAKFGFTDYIFDIKDKSTSTTNVSHNILRYKENDTIEYYVCLMDNSVAEAYFVKLSSQQN